MAPTRSWSWTIGCHYRIRQEGLQKLAVFDGHFSPKSKNEPRYLPMMSNDLEPKTRLSTQKPMEHFCKRCLLQRYGCVGLKRKQNESSDSAKPTKPPNPSISKLSKSKMHQKNILPHTKSLWAIQKGIKQHLHQSIKQMLQQFIDFLRLFKSKTEPLGFFYWTLELVGCMAHKVLTLSEAYGLMLRILSWNSG